ncbi:MAG: hypothetical protein ACJAY4_000681, partial [Cryomorphaceae bacterium]
MKHLYNGEDWRVLKKRMIESDHDRVTVSFYQYAKLDNPPFFRDYL